MRLLPRCNALFLSVAVAALICGPISAAEKPDAPTVKKLILQSAAEPQPALKYTLLPGFLDGLPGNAASDYRRLIIHWQSRWQDPDNDKLNEQLAEWLEMPLEEFPKDEVRDMLQKRRVIWEGLVKAARRDNCQWSFRVREST
jgi:hypothetical protein